MDLKKLLIIGTSLLALNSQAITITSLEGDWPGDIVVQFDGDTEGTTDFLNGDLYGQAHYLFEDDRAQITILQSAIGLDLSVVWNPFTGEVLNTQAFGPLGYAFGPLFDYDTQTGGGSITWLSTPVPDYGSTLGLLALGGLLIRKCRR